ncbi:MAG TPA: hypothetical protein VHW23_45450 [Kofleriaceae bacterium]|jgi:hypothetical protein|nr:hypothetical protein [Kofleriaceae bacterium]
MLRVMSIAAVLAACGGRPPGPPAAPAAPPAAPAAAQPARPAEPAVAADATPLDQDLPRLVDRALAMYRDVAGALGGEDCAAASARLRALSSRYHDVVAANARVLRAGRAGQLREALEPHGDEFDAAAQAVVGSPAMAKCAPDPAFEKAFDDILAPP